MLNEGNQLLLILKKMKNTPPSGGLKAVLGRLDPNLARVFVPFAFRHPSKLWAYGRLVRAYKRSVQLRQIARVNGSIVPPFLILSITSRCNLKCMGCYAAAVGTVHSNSSGTETCNRNLNLDQWRHIIQEASDLGIFGFILAGGEPFVFPGLLDFCETFKNHIFVIFTNGTALKEDDFARLKHLPNVVVVVSIEGNQYVTDQRRGHGVYEKVLQTVHRLNKMGVVSGISVTINRLNFEYWMSDTSVDDLISQGVRFGFFIEYIPVSHLPNDLLCLSREERVAFRAKVLEYRAQKAIYLVHSPGDEELVGGCISAGRGFAHVTPDGDLTPCPVSNIATHNLTKTTLQDGLNSPLFQRIRESDHLLENGDTPCALFTHPQEVEALVRITGAYRTGKK